MHVLLLEDDSTLALTLIDALEYEGITVTHVQDGNEALDATYATHFDGYLFDVNVAFIDGFTLLKELRQADDTTPTFFITALNDIHSITKGFNVGAQDYIKKPFDIDELIVRIKAKFSQSDTSMLTYKNLSIKEHMLFENDLPVDLGKIRFEILKLFIHNVGHTLDKATLFELLEHESDRALRVHITQLKQRFNLPITNVRSVGYRLEKA